MNANKSIPLSVVVLLLGGMVVVILLSFVFKLETSTTVVAAALFAGMLILLATALLYWIARELERSEERLRVIVDSTQDGIITTNEMGVIESVNARVTELFGYRPGKLMGQHISVLLSSTHEERVDGESLLRYLEREQLGALGASQLVRGLHQDGQRFHMDFAVNEVWLGGEVCFTVMVRDVSERVTAQKVLHESKDELERRVKERTAALEESNERLHDEITRRKDLIQELQAALGDIKTLSGLLPICASCKKIRDDGGYWNQIEVFIREHSDAEFSHSVCPECIEQLYPDLHVPHTDL